MDASVALRVDDLLKLPDPGDGSRYELSRGELITVPPNENARHFLMRTDLADELASFVRQNKIGKVFQEGPFKLGVDTARIPDIAFASNETLRTMSPGTGVLALIPDFVIEIVSPSDLAVDVDSKTREYQEAGVPTIVYIYPESRSVYVRSGGNIRVLRESDILSFEALPGFSLPLSALFR